MLVLRLGARLWCQASYHAQDEAGLQPALIRVGEPQRDALGWYESGPLALGGDGDEGRDLSMNREKA
jgi:hypothetical protein